MRKFVLLPLTMMVLAIVFAGARPAPARAGDASAKPALLKGTFAYLDNTTDDGFTIATGSLTFDGVSRVTGVMDLNGDGDICTGLTVAGFYTVNPDNTTGSLALMVSGFTDSISCSKNFTSLTLNAPIAFARAGTAISVIYINEIDPYTSGTFADELEPFSAVATFRRPLPP
jgi:hypothetical protein